MFRKYNRPLQKRSIVTIEIVIHIKKPENTRRENEDYFISKEYRYSVIRNNPFSLHIEYLLTAHQPRFY